jgi:transcriptional regulatory protein LevR
MAIDPALEARLGLLTSSGQIDPDVAEFMIWALAEIEARLGVEVNEEGFSTLCTHMAMALQRARNGKQVETWESKHDELADYPQAVSRAEALADAAQERLGTDLSAPEREFVALHLAAVEARGG